MNSRSLILALAFATALGSAVFVISGAALTAGTTAQTTDKSAVKAAVINASTDAEEANYINIVEDSAKAFGSIQAARLSLSNGKAEEAAIFANDAQYNLLRAMDRLTELALMSTQTNEVGNYLLPFIAFMIPAEDIFPSTGNSTMLERAQEHFSRGGNTEAVDALKYPKIDLSVKIAKLPGAESLQHVKDAIVLIKDKKYHEADIALKAVQDSVIVESFDINKAPFSVS